MELKEISEEISKLSENDEKIQKLLCDRIFHILIFIFFIGCLLNLKVNNFKEIFEDLETAEKIAKNSQLVFYDRLI